MRGVSPSISQVIWVVIGTESIREVVGTKQSWRHNISLQQTTFFTLLYCQYAQSKKLQLLQSIRYPRCASQVQSFQVIGVKMRGPNLFECSCKKKPDQMERTRKRQRAGVVDENEKSLRTGAPCCPCTLNMTSKHHYYIKRRINKLDHNAPCEKYSSLLFGGQTAHRASTVGCYQ